MVRAEKWLQLKEHVLEGKGSSKNFPRQKKRPEIHIDIWRTQKAQRGSVRPEKLRKSMYPCDSALSRSSEGGIKASKTVQWRKALATPEDLGPVSRIFTGERDEQLPQAVAALRSSWAAHWCFSHSGSPFTAGFCLTQRDTWGLPSLMVQQKERDTYLWLQNSGACLCSLMSHNNLWLQFLSISLLSTVLSINCQPLTPSYHIN